MPKQPHKRIMKNTLAEHYELKFNFILVNPEITTELQLYCFDTREDFWDDFDGWLYSCGSITLYHLAYITPHGKRGDDEHTLRFKYKDDYYDVTVTNIEWNRYDKQFYYIEDTYGKENIKYTKVI